MKPSKLIFPKINTSIKKNLEFVFLIFIALTVIILIQTYNFIKDQKNSIFSRMTGSGSTCIGYFNDLTSAQKAKKNITIKFPNYWCEVAKTI